MRSRSDYKPGPRVDLPGQIELPVTGRDAVSLAKRKIGGPIRAPDKPQKPMDIGLWSDDNSQVDLEDLL